MLAVVLFLIAGCFMAIFSDVWATLSTIPMWIKRSDCLTERRDDMIDYYSAGKLAERFTFITSQIDLSKIDAAI